MNRRLVGSFLVLALGCNSPTTANDANVGGNDANTGGTDTGPPVDSGPVVPNPLAVTSPDVLDMSCNRTATVPVGGAATSAIVEVTEYVSMAPVADTTVQLFTDAIVTPTCTSPICVTGMTDSTGHVTLMAPAGGWVGLRLVPSAGTAEVLAYNQTWPTTAGAPFETAAFSATSIGLVSSLLGRTFDSANAGAISGQYNDCMENTVANAHPRVFRGTTEIVTGPSSNRMSPRITGLMGTNPTRQGFTGDGGTFVGANVPTGDDYHVEIWGVLTAGGAEQLVGCEEGRVVAGGITVLVIGPLRSDYATGSACAMAVAANP